MTHDTPAPARSSDLDERVCHDAPRGTGRAAWAPSAHKVAAETSRYQALRERLAAEFPEADEETLLDTLEGLSELPELVGAVVRSSLDDKDMVEALKLRIGELQGRMTRLNERAQRKRALAAETLREAGMKKLVLADMTLSLRPVAPAVHVADEGLIPEDYWKPQPPKLDKRSLREDILSGREVPGTVLAHQADALSVRTA